MEEKDLINKIQLLKQVKPKEDWVIFCRSRLAFRLEMERKRGLLNKDLFALREVFAFWRVKQPGLALKAAYALILVLGMILGSGVLVALAAMNSSPGSPLYPVKLAIERARVSTSLSEESRFQLQTQLADARLQELTDVVNSQDPADQKVEKMSQVAESIQNQLATVNNQLPKAGTKAEPQKALAAAKMVSEKASQASKALAAAKESLPGSDKADLNAKLAQATEAVDKVGIDALEAMITNQGVSSTTKEEIAVKLGDEIKKTEDQVKLKEQKIVQKDSFADKLPIRAVLISQFEQSLELLDQAKEDLNKGDLKGSLDMLKAAKAIDSGTDKMTQNASNSSTKDQSQSATSSDAVNVVK